MRRLPILLAELKRRRVYHVAVVYAAAAFVAAQAAEVFLPRLGFPDWTVTLVVILAVVGFPVAIVLGWVFDITPTGVRRTPAIPEHPLPSPGRWRLAIGVVAAAVLMTSGTWWLSGIAFRDPIPSNSLAVLPLKNLMGDPEQDYFVEGMHGALTAELSKIAALRVISQTSAMLYRDSDKSMPQIARELGVEGLIEGSVLRDGDRVRITVQLIHGPSDHHLWAGSYQRDLRDILALQSDVALAIAREVLVTLTPEEETRLATARPVDPEAYQLWLKGNFHLNRLNEESFRRALSLYEDAIAIDPSYAPAHAGVASAYIWLGSLLATVPPPEVVPKARQAAERALALDPELASAHWALGTIRFWFEWDWAGAERAFRQAIALSREVTGMYALFLAVLGRFDESIEVGNQIRERDPLSPNSYFFPASMLSLAGDDERALELYRQGFDLDLHYFQGHLMIASFHYARKGDVDMALSHLERAIAIQETARAMGWLGYVHASAGRRTEAVSMVSRLMERKQRAYTHQEAEALAFVHIGLGNHDEALRWLEAAYEEREMGLIWLNELWVFDPLRGHPRFQSLLRRMNFPS